LTYHRTAEEAPYQAAERFGMAFIALNTRERLADPKLRRHTGAIMKDTKIFVGLRSTRKPSVTKNDISGPKCQWEGCGKVGSHRAPVGQEAEGLFLQFCLDHVKQYNSGYNYSASLSTPEVARYQREAATGLRATGGSETPQAREMPLPSTARSGSAKVWNARKTAAQRQAEKAAAQTRKLKVLEVKAFETLGLPTDAAADEIKQRYKQRLKMYHPDVNQGDRNAEGQLRASIEAHRILKLNGFC
jgi:hypothetical protein